MEVYDLCFTFISAEINVLKNVSFGGVEFYDLPALGRIEVYDLPTLLFCRNKRSFLQSL